MSRLSKSYHLITSENSAMKIKILDSDSPEVKAEKQGMIDFYNDILEESKKLFKDAGFDPYDKAGVEKIEELFAKKAAELKIKQGEKEVLLVDALKELQTQFDALSTKVNKDSADTKVERKSFAQAILDGFKEKADEIKGILDRGGKQDGPLNIQVKSAVVMGDYNTIEAVGSASHYTLTSNTGIISAIRHRILRYLSGVSVGGLSVDKPYAMWIEELDEQGNPIFIGEGDDKTQLSVRYEEREKKAKKIGVYGKVTTEMLRYLPQLISYIQNNLIKRMDIKTEDQLFSGNGTGDNLSGILGYATAFDGGAGVAGDGLAGTVEFASDWDVIRAIALQVENSYGIPNRLFLTPDRIANMDVEKDQEGRYLLPPFKNANGTIVAGLELIPTLGLAGTGYDFVGGDLSVVHVEFLYQTNIQIGLDGNDFTKNLKTILVEQELVQFVSANDTQVLVKGDFGSAKAMLEAGT
jgi:HK97 family phage major capsid protein